MAIPIISFVVVIKGPIAKAGSIFIRLSIIGIVEPTVAAKQTAISKQYQYQDQEHDQYQ